MSEMTTPRTDAAERWDVLAEIVVVPASFARQLERELAAEKAWAEEAITRAEERMNREIGEMRVLIQPLYDELDAALAQVATLREAAQDFCDKVDCGEARSIRSYAKFKAALSATHNAKHPDTERIDWLDEYMSHHGGGNGGVYSFRTPADVECGMLREAIDAARKAHP